MAYLKHRLTLTNVKRILVACLNDPDFTRLHALVKRTQYARDPEQFLIWALDASAHIGEVWAVGLFLLSHFSDTEADLLALLVRTCSFPRGTPTWRYEKAASAALRWKASEVRTWKHRGLSAVVAARKAQRERSLKEAWATLERRIKRLHERALARLGVE